MYEEKCKVTYNYGKECVKVPREECKYETIPKCKNVPVEKCETGYADKCKETPVKTGNKVTKHRCVWPKRQAKDDTRC